MGEQTSPGAAQWITPFLRGVASAVPARALLNDAAGRGVLIDLDHGRRLWRSVAPLRPLALDAALAWALEAAPMRVVALDAVSGKPRWRSAPLPWPTWAAASAQAAGLGGASTLHAGWADADGLGSPPGLSDLLLVWRLRQPSGGMKRAAPSAAVQGACRIARADGSVLPWEGASAAADDAGVLSAHAQVLESADPAVLAQEQHQNWRYALVQHAVGAAGAADPQALQLMLEAESTAKAQPPWQCLLDDQPGPRHKARPPPPKR